MIRGFCLFAAVAAPTAALAQARNAETVLMSENERYRADQEKFGFSGTAVQVVRLLPGGGIAEIKVVAPRSAVALNVDARRSAPAEQGRN